MGKRFWVFALLFFIVTGLAFARSDAYEQIETQIMSSTTYPDIRYKVLNFSTSIKSITNDVSKKLRFYEGRGDEANAGIAREELAAIASDSVSRVTVDHCLQVLYSSGYTRQKEQELRLELFKALGISVNVRFRYSDMGTGLSDEAITYLPYDTIVIPSQAGGEKIEFWESDSGQILTAGQSLELAWDSISLSPIVKDAVIFYPGNNLGSFIIKFDPETGMMTFPDITDRGHDQSTFGGWEIDGTIYRAGETLRNPGNLMKGRGIWNNYDVELKSISEIDGNGDGKIQDGETAEVYLELLREGVGDGNANVTLYAPSALAGKVAVSGKTIQFPMEEGIRIQVAKGYEPPAISLVAKIQDSRGYVYYRTVDISISPNSIDVSAGIVDYSEAAGMIFVQVVNRSDSVSLVLPLFKLQSQDGGVQIESDWKRYETIPPGQSAFVKFEVTSLDSRLEPLLSLLYKDKFGNEGMIPFQLKSSGGSSDDARRLSFSGYAVEQVFTNGHNVLKVEPMLFNSGEAVAKALRVEASIDGEKWSGFEIPRVGIGMHGTSSGEFESAGDAKENLFSSSSMPIELVLDPQAIAKNAMLSSALSASAGSVTVLLKAEDAYGNAWRSSFNFELQESQMDISLEDFSLTGLGNRDDRLEGGENFGISLAVRNNNANDWTNVRVTVRSEDPSIIMQGQQAVIPLIKAGEVANVQFSPSWPLANQLSGMVDPYISEDSQCTIEIAISKTGKSGVEFGRNVEAFAFKPDVTVQRMFVKGKQSSEKVYPGDSVELKPVLVYYGHEALSDVSCTITPLSSALKGEGRLWIGSINGTVVPAAYSSPAIEVSGKVPAGARLPVRLLFTEGNGRSFYCDSWIEMGRRYYDFVFRDVYVLDSANSRQKLEAHPGDTVEIGFDFVNIAQDDSPLVYASIAVSSGNAESIGTAMQSLGAVTHGRVVRVSDMSSGTRPRLLVRISPDAVPGDKVDFSLKLYSLLTLIQSEDFQITII